MLVGVRGGFQEIFGVIAEDSGSQLLAQEIASALRAQKLQVDQSYVNNPRKQMDKLQRREITTAIFVRSSENDQSLATIRVKRFRNFRHPVRSIIKKRIEKKYTIVGFPTGTEESSFLTFDFLLVRRNDHF
jgi:histidyl-tRNA synthetase